MLTAVQTSREAILDAPKELLADRNVVLTAISADENPNWCGDLCYILEAISPDLKADREVVLAAVRKKRFCVTVWFGTLSCRSRDCVGRCGKLPLRT